MPRAKATTIHDPRVQSVSDERDRRVSEDHVRRVSDERDQHPLFDQWRTEWARQVAQSPLLSRLSPATQDAIAIRMARSSVRFDETVSHKV